ncbi:MAG: MucR family transcriptional regulator [Geminicoccales bacterium]
MICGKPRKRLTRHLATGHALAPDAYRALFELKDDDPLVAPSYAVTRSALAKKISLGKKTQPVKPVRAPRKRTVKPTAKKA